MEDAGGSGGPPDWRAAIQVREEPDLARELLDRFERTSGLRSVGVTDLLATRRAYWRLLVPPVPVPPERRARMETGRLLHRQLGTVLGREGQLEVRVRRDGIVGRIDALTDRPIEVKTATLAAQVDLLVEDRPEYVEQLGMYCALLERAEGRIVTFEVREGEVEAVRTVDVRFRHPRAILEEMRRRALALRSAWERREPAALARCPWFDRGCEFRAGPTCDCTGEEGNESAALLEEVRSVRGVPEEDARLLMALQSVVRPERPPTVARFRDLVYPRRTFFERTRPPPPPEPWVSPLEGPPDTYARLTEAVESGPVGEVSRLPPLADEPEEEVAAFRGDPFLVRTSVARAPPTAAEVPERFPQYVLELGFRCVATGRNSGRVIAAYERAAKESDRLRVFRVDLTPATAFARLWRRRLGDLERALRQDDGRALPACPRWMFENCPYRSECGCGGSEPERSHR